MGLWVKMAFTLKMDKKPLIVARTGDCQNYPENTLPAFESAIRKGADGIELDVHPTSDGHLVVHHFYNLGSTDDGQGLVDEHTLAELKALDSGSWFGARFAGETKPTLGEVLELGRGRIRFEIDLKGSDLEFLRAVIREVERFDLAAGVELASAHVPLLMQVKRIDPGLRIGAFFYQPPDWMPLRLAQKHALDWAALSGIDAVHLHLSLVTREFVGELHRRNLLVHGSNLDAEVDILRGIQLGVDSFSTGRLDLAPNPNSALSRPASRGSQSFTRF